MKNVETTIAPEIALKNELQELFSRLRAPFDEDTADPVRVNRRGRYDLQLQELQALVSSKDKVSYKRLMQDTSQAAEAMSTLASESTLSGDNQKLAERLFRQASELLYGRQDRMTLGILSTYLRSELPGFDFKQTSALEKKLRGFNEQMSGLSSSAESAIAKIDQLLEQVSVAMETLASQERDYTQPELQSLERLVKISSALQTERGNYEKKLEQVAQVETSKRVAGARAKMEQRHAPIDRAREQEVREKILFMEISAAGSSSIATSFPKDFSPYPGGYRLGGGFGTAYDEKRTANAIYGQDSHIDQETESVTEQFGINEVVFLKPMHRRRRVGMEPVDRPARGLRGLLGGKTKEEQPVYKDVLFSHDEAVQGGGKEQAYSFVYNASDPSNAPKHEYKDYSDRRGQYFFIDHIIPEHIAKQLAKHLAEDPSAARRLAEFLFLHHHDKKPDHTDQDWEKLWRDGEGNGSKKIPLRPPYEAWAKNGGGTSKMLVDLNVPGTLVSPPETEKKIVPIGK